MVSYTKLYVNTRVVVWINDDVTVLSFRKTSNTFEIRCDCWTSSYTYTRL